MVTWSGSDSRGMKHSAQLGRRVVLCPIWLGGPCSWSSVALWSGWHVGRASLQGIAGGHQQVYSCRWVEQGTGPVLRTWLVWVVPWLSWRLTRLDHCFSGSLGNSGCGRCSNPWWTLQTGGWRTVGRCPSRLLLEFHVLRRVPLALQSSLRCYTGMVTSFSQMAFLCSSQQSPNTRICRNWSSQLPGVAMVVQVLGWIGVVVVVPVGGVVGMLGMLQPSSWCRRWYQASKHTVWLGTGIWRCLGVLADHLLDSVEGFLVGIVPGELWIFLQQFSQGCGKRREGRDERWQVCGHT